MGKAAWTKGAGPLVPFANGMRSELIRHGYSKGATKHHMIVMGQLNRWLLRQGIGVGEISLRLAEQFLVHRRACGQRRVPTLQTLGPLFEHLRDQQALPVEEVAERAALDELVARYRHHLIHDRDLAPNTVLRYERTARRFLTRRASETGGETGAEGLGSEDITAYLLECCSRLVVTSAKREAADIRALLRFLYLEGLIHTDLGVSLPPVAGWRDTGLPATLSRAEIAAVLDSCDRSSATGLRDLAILSLLARLGLRAGEVAAIQLDDIDWRAGEIMVRAKARREERLPITEDVGESLVAYLRDARPASDCRNLILTGYAPFRRIHPSSITSVVYRACRRAGLARAGAHRLRHSLAREMLRQGGNLVEISQVLRHRDVATTLLYAKVDLDALRTVSRPWPGVGR